MRRKYRCQSSDSTDFHFCEECFQKQLKIDKLKTENEYLRAQLNYRKRKDKQPFGSSTPSSKLNFKKNSDTESQRKRGGAKKGHKGYGRKLWDEKQSDEVIDLKVELEECPDCGGKLESHGIDYRSIVDAALFEAKKLLYKIQIKHCKDCRQEVSNQPLVLPKFKYGNNLIANAAITHFLEGVPLKRMVAMLGKDTVSSSGFHHIFHWLSQKWEPVINDIKKEYQQSPVKHADETGWRTDGQNGYSWLFCNDKLSLFSFEKTRSAKVPEEFLGTEPLSGVLVVDRYNGYNQVKCNIQYCYAHLLRDVNDLEKEFPKNNEIKKFVSEFGTCLSDAIKLRRTAKNDKIYYRTATELKEKIKMLARAPAKHLGIHKIQDIFIEKEHRLFHWVDDRKVPAENNKAEREIRPTVIARKVSFGSQSPKGAKTRSILMSVFHTAAKRLGNDQTIKQWFVSTLDRLSENPDVDLVTLLPGS